jgi:hypothetical protein
MPGRIVAALLGAVALIITAILTGGGALGAFLGVVAAAMIARKQRRGLSRRASWVGAVAGSAVVLVGLSAWMFSALPRGSYAQIQRSADSASANSKPPAWLGRVAPNAGAPALKPDPKSGLGKGFQLWATITGGVMALAMFAAIVGSVGWLVTLPLAFAWRGQWLPWTTEPATDWLRGIG